VLFDTSVEKTAHPTHVPQSFYLPNSTYPMSTALIKLALCFQYLRVLGPDSPRLRLVTKVVIVVTALWGFAYSFIAWVPCWPVSAYWDWSVPVVARWGFGSHDVSVFVGTYISHVASNVVLDLIVFAIPLPLYFDPTLTQKSKVGLCGLVVLGLMSVQLLVLSAAGRQISADSDLASSVNVLSTWRLALLVQTRASTSPTLDPSWYGCEPIVLAALEIDLALICASLPVFWPVIEKSLGSIFVTYEVEVTRETSPKDTELSPLSSMTEPPPAHTTVGRSHVSYRWSLIPFSSSNSTATKSRSEPMYGRHHTSRGKGLEELRDERKASSEATLLPV